MKLFRLILNLVTLLTVLGFVLAGCSGGGGGGNGTGGGGGTGQGLVQIVGTSNQ